MIYFDETDELTVQKATPCIQHAFGQVFGVGDAGFADRSKLVVTFESRGEHGSAEIARNMTNVEYLMDRGLVFVGSPETVARALRKASAEGLFNSIFAEFNLSEGTEGRSQLPMEPGEELTLVYPGDSIGDGITWKQSY